MLVYIRDSELKNVLQDVTDSDIPVEVSWRGVGSIRENVLSGGINYDKFTAEYEIIRRTSNRADPTQGA